MAVLSIGAGYGYEWIAVLGHVLQSGAVVGSPSGAGTLTIRLAGDPQYGVIEIVLTGSGLAGSGRTVSAGSITAIAITADGEPVLDVGSYGTPVTSAAFQNLLNNPGSNHWDPSPGSPFRAVFLPESMEIHTVDGGDLPNSAFDDTIYGSTRDDWGGSDIITPGPGADTIHAGDGNDYDIINFGAAGGTLGIIVNLSGASVTHDLGGPDEITLADGEVRDSFGAVDTISGFELITGTDRPDVFYVAPSGTFITFSGGAGDDVFHVLGPGTGLPDLVGGAGRDTFNLAGYNAEQTISYDAEVGDHEDWDPATHHGVIVNLSGNELPDVSIDSFAPGVPVAAHTAFDTFDNVDTIIKAASVGDEGGTVRIEATDAQDHIVGSDDDTVFEMFEGRGGDDRLYGGGGNDELLGGEGHDQLYGGDGDDSLYGGSGDDSLYGGDGDDVLEAGENGGTLYGGDGNDTLDGRDGSAHFYGGRGDDTIIASEIEYDKLRYTDADSDRGIIANLSSDEQDSVIHDGVTVGAGQVRDNFNGTDTVSGIDHIDGTELGDEFFTGDTFTVAGTAPVELVGGDGVDTFILGEATATDGDGAAGVTLHYRYEQELAGYDYDGTWGQSGAWAGKHGVIVNLSAATDLDDVTIANLGPVDVAAGTAIDTYGKKDVIRVATEGYVIVTGTDAEDYIRGHDVSSVSERFDGDGGDDTLIGGAGYTELYGGSGDDELDSGSGDDDLYGGIGDDDLDGGAGIDTAHFGTAYQPGMLAAVADADPATLGDQAGWRVTTGAEGTDNLVGVEVVVFAGTRYLLIDNHAEAGGTWTTSHGGFANLEAAMTYAQAGDIFVYLNEPSDIQVDQSAATDPVNFGYSGTAPVAVTTGSGNDHVRTGGGGDTVRTGGGNDYVDAGEGNDTIIGGSGNGDDVYDGGAGDGDTLVLHSATHTVTVDLNAIVRTSTPVRGADGGGGAPDTIGELLVANALPGNRPVGIADGVDIGTDALIGVENVEGGAGDDTLAGSGVRNILKGGGGNDTLAGGGGNDVLDGQGGAQDTAVFSGSWRDYAVSKAGSTITVTDTRGGSPDGTDTVTGVERFRFANGTFSASAILNDAPTRVVLSASTVIENAANGTVVGTLSATDADAPLGDTATFSLVGDGAGGRFAIAGNKLVVASGALLDYEAATSHLVTVRATDARGATVQKTLTITLADNPADDPSPPPPPPTPADPPTPPTPPAEDPPQYLSGGKKADTLVGGSGPDTLFGGGGNDTLTGGAGADTFQFASKLNGKKNVDTITDFAAGIDRIELDRSFFKKLKVGDLDPKAFTAGKAKGDDRIIYNKKTGDLFYDADGKGGKKAVKFAKLEGSPDDLGAADFVVVA